MSNDGKRPDDEDMSFRVPIRPKDAARLRELGGVLGRFFRAAGELLDAGRDVTRVARDPDARAKVVGTWQACVCGKGGAFDNSEHLQCEACRRVFDPESKSWR